MHDLNERYLEQLKEDRTALQAMLETRRHALDDTGSLDGDWFEGKRLSPSIRLMDQSYLMILEDAEKVLNSLIEYFTPKQPQARFEINPEIEPQTQ